MVIKLPRIGLGKWVLGAAFIAGLNLLVAGANAGPTKQNTILPGIARQSSLPSLMLAEAGGNIPPGLGYKPGKGNNPGQDNKGGNGDNNGGSPVTVPDSGTTLLLLGGAFLGLAIASRKMKASPVRP